MQFQAWVLEAPLSEMPALQRALADGHVPATDRLTGTSLVNIPTRALFLGETLSTKLAHDYSQAGETPPLTRVAPGKATAVGSGVGDIFRGSETGYIVEVTPTSEGTGALKMSGRLALRDPSHAGTPQSQTTDPKFHEHEMYFRLTSATGEAVMTPFITTADNRVVTLIIRARPVNTRRAQRG